MVFNKDRNKDDYNMLLEKDSYKKIQYAIFLDECLYITNAISQSLS